MINKQLEKFELREPNPFFSAHIVRSMHRDEPNIMSGVPDGIDSSQVYVFAAQVSNQNLDSYYTKMANSSLTNYAEDAREGVAFLDSHQHHNRIGYSFNGKLIADDMPRVIADFYTARGLKLGSLSTDDFISGVEFGLMRDVSIGFKEGDGFQYSCSICSRDLFDWDCEHIPGFEYEVTTNPDAEPDNQVSEMRRAFAWIENARLSEVSAVFDGATPDAMIVKATREHRAGRLRGNSLDAFERRNRIHLPRSEKFSGVELNSEQGEEAMGTKDGDSSGAPDNLLEREALIEARSFGVKLEDSLSVMEIIRGLGEEIKRLAPFEKDAHEGKVLRTALVEDTLAEGVRAFGNDFNKEAKTTMLEGMDIEVIREMRASWQEIADAKFAGKGRSSEENPDGEGDEEEGEKPVEVAVGYPDEAIGGV